MIQTEEYIQCVASEVTPVAMTTEMIEEASKSDQELKELREIVINGRWHELNNKSYLPIRHERSTLGFLILRGTRIVIPSELRDKILELGHEGHPGFDETTVKVKSMVALY